MKLRRELRLSPPAKAPVRLAPELSRSSSRLLWYVPIAAALAALAVAALGLAPHTIPALYLAAAAPELARVDLREHRLPNRLTLTGIAVGIVAAGISWLATQQVPVVALAAGAASALLLLVLSLGGGMGMGDVKLGAAIGLASPTLAIAVAAPLAAFLLGGAAGTVVLIARGRGSRIAFGPYLLAGYVVALASAIGLSVARP